MNTPTIDAHVHAGIFGQHYPEAFAFDMMAKTPTPDPASINQPIDVLLARMDAVGVDCAILLAFDAERTAGVKVPNDWVAEACNRNPERFVGFASVDPASANAHRELEFALEELGMQGVKLAPCYLGLSPNDPLCEPVYRQAEALNLPVLVHVGYTPAGTADARYFPPHPLGAVAAAHPELRLIMAHLGTPWVNHSLRLMVDHPTVWADLSIFGWYQPVEIVASVLYQARRLGVLNRLMWGSDSPFGPMSESLQRLRAINGHGPLRSDPLSDAELSMVIGVNAQRLLQHNGKDLHAEPET